MSINSSQNLQQSLIQSIQESKSKSKPSQSLMSESLISQSMMSVSRTSRKSLQENRTNNNSTSNITKIENLNPQNLNQQWLSFYSTLQSQFTHYFFEIQQELNQMQVQINQKELKEILTLIELVREKTDCVRHIVGCEHLYLLNAFENVLLIFQDLLEKLKPSFGITSLKAAINDFDQLELQDTYNFLQETFSTFIMTHFFQAQTFDKIIEEQDLQFDSQSSISSDFSDEKNDVEQFEANTTLEIMNQMKLNLVDDQIYQQSKEFTLTLDSDDFYLKGFFNNIINLDEISNYEILCYIYYSGLLIKSLGSKAKTPTELLKQVLCYFQNILVKIRTLSKQQLKEFVHQNLYELEYFHFSKKSFFSKRNLFKAQIYDVLLNKLQRWKLMHLNTMELQQEFNEELEGIYNDLTKKAFRKLSLKWKMPINKFETRVIVWDKQTFLLQQSNQFQRGNQDVFVRIQNICLSLYQNYQDLLYYFNEQDIAQSGKIELKQFLMSLKVASIPVTNKEILDLFRQFQKVEGCISKEGITIRKFVDYQELIFKIYGILQETQNSQDMVQNSQMEKSQSQMQGEKTQSLVKQYSKENTQLLLIKNLQGINYKLKAERVEIYNLINYQSNIQSQLQQQQTQINQLVQGLEDKDQEMLRLKQSINEIQKHTDEQVKTYGNLTFQTIFIDLQNIENLQNYSNINQGMSNKLLIKENQWNVEKNKLLRELTLKDKQIQQYRIELEGVVNEIAHIKTCRQE